VKNILESIYKRMILMYDSPIAKEELCRHAQSVNMPKWLKTENTLAGSGIAASHVRFNLPEQLLADGPRLKKRLPFCCIL